jgi:hypothetical protein
MAEGAAKECIGAADLLDSRTRLNPQTVQLAPLINEVIGTAGQLAEQNKSRWRYACMSRPYVRTIEKPLQKIVSGYRPWRGAEQPGDWKTY